MQRLVMAVIFDLLAPGGFSADSDSSNVFSSLRADMTTSTRVELEQAERALRVWCMGWQGCAGYFGVVERRRYVTESTSTPVKQTRRRRVVR